jgi:hypothetical protein
MSTKSSTAAEPADSPVELAHLAIPGWWLNFVAGMVPLLAGLVVLLISWLGVARADSKWWTGLGTLDFSYSDLAAAGSDAPPWVEMLGSVGGVNIVAGPSRSAWLRASDSGTDSAGPGGSLPSVSYGSVCTMPS